MSIVAILGSTEPSPTVESLVVAVWLIVAIGLAIRYRILFPQTAGGPARVEPGESLAPLAGIMFISFAAWQMAAGIFVSSLGVPAATRPIELSPAQTVYSGAIAPLAGIAVMLFAHAVFSSAASLKKLGLGFGALRRSPGPAILGLICILPAVQLTAVGLEVLYRLINYEHPTKHELLRILEQMPDPLVNTVLIITAIVVAPLFEELLFRGHLQTLFRATTRRPWLAILLSATVFAMVHEPWSAPAIFLLAVGLGYAYERTGNLWVSIFMHAGFNALSIVATKVL